MLSFPGFVVFVLEGVLYWKSCNALPFVKAEELSFPTPASQTPAFGSTTHNKGIVQSARSGRNKKQ